MQGIAGQSGPPGPRGLPGPPGRDGQDGRDGKDGIDAAFGRFGKVGWVNAHAPRTREYSPNKGAQWNSTKDEDGKANVNRVVREGVGRYVVIFPGLGERRSAGMPQVTTLGTGLHCRVKAIESRGNDARIEIQCTGTRGGRFGDTRFTVFYMA